MWLPRQFSGAGRLPKHRRHQRAAGRGLLVQGTHDICHSVSRQPAAWSHLCMTQQWQRRLRRCEHRWRVQMHGALLVRAGTAAPASPAVTATHARLHPAISWHRACPNSCCGARTARPPHLRAGPAAVAGRQAPTLLHKRLVQADGRPHIVRLRAQLRGAVSGSKPQTAHSACGCMRASKAASSRESRAHPFTSRALPK